MKMTLGNVAKLTKWTFPIKQGAGLPRGKQRWALVLGLFVMVVTTTLYLLDDGLGGTFARLECQEIDLAFKLRGPTPPSPDVVIVAIDDESLGEMEYQGYPWPWPRSIHGQLIERLKVDGAKVIVFDVVFDTSSIKAEDQYFAQAIKSAGNVVLACQLAKVKKNGAVVDSVQAPVSPMVEAAATTAYANLPRDEDGFVRRGAYSKDTLFGYSPMSVAALNLFGDRGIAAVKNVSQSTRRDKSIQLNYSGPPASYPFIPYYEALQGVGKDVSSRFRGKIVLVGDTSTLLHDTVPTPFAGKRQMPGVEAHATAIGTMLNGNPIHTVEHSGRAVAVVIAGIAATLIATFAKPIRGIMTAAVILIGTLGVGITAFINWNLWLPFLVLPIAFAASFSASTGYRLVSEELEKRRIHDIFGRYVSKDVAGTILDSRDGLQLGGMRRDVTMLFSDIRGFTSMSERLPAEDVVTLLNEYFQEMTDAIFQEGGTVDKFIGDCIMAVFGAPVEAPDHAERAVRAALAMRSKLRMLQEKWTARGSTAFDTGIGINTGEVVVGNIGSTSRTEYTVIGSACNMAARLESATKDLGVSILIGPETNKRVNKSVTTRCLGEVSLKGIAQPVEVWTVIDTSAS